MKVTRYRRSENTGALVGYFSLEFDMRFGDNFEFIAPMSLNDMKFFNKNGKQWVVSADRKYTDQEGQEKYAPYYGIFNRECNDIFQKEVLKALSSFLNKGGATTTPTTSQNANTRKVKALPDDISNASTHYPHVNAQVQSKSDQDDLPF